MSYAILGERYACMHACIRRLCARLFISVLQFLIKIDACLAVHEYFCPIPRILGRYYARTVFRVSSLVW